MESRGIGQIRDANGAAADLVVFDPDRAWRIDETLMKSRSKNTPFDKRPVQGKAMMTIVDGRTLYRAPDAPL